MISTDDRSPTAGSPPPDSTTTRLNFNNNNNEDIENNRLYYQYQAPASASSSPPRDSPLQQLTSSQSTPSISTPASPILQHRQHHNSYSSLNLNHQHQQPIILRDPNSSSTPLLNHLWESPSSTAVALPSRSPPATTNGIADFIHHTLSARLIPKLGSIVKRFSLNYSGEGLVTDRQRTRTVRVGIRFQVQVDSFINNRLQDNNRPRAILRTQSAPVVDQLDSGFSSPTTDVFPQNTQLALEYNNHQPSSIKNISQSQSNSSSSLSVGGSSVDYTSCGAGSSNGIQIGIGGSGVDSCSSCVSSEASSPTLDRRANLTWPRDNHNHSQISNQSSHHHPNSNTLAFHNRINQALNSYRNNQQQQSADNQQRARRSSVQVYRRGSASPERSSSIPSPAEHNSMEDSSSYQVLRHFPGSNVNSLNELSWETAAFEKEIRDRIQWLGDKVSSIRVPRVINQLIDFGKDYARENPVTALVLLALCLTSSAPVLIFLVFAVLTILVTFLGFLFVEGTLLTGATVIFGGVILLVGFITLSAVLVGMLGYFTTNQAYLVITGRSQIFRLLRKIPIIGNLFPEPPVQLVENSNQYSSLLANGSVSSSVAGGGDNGKLANGHGPYHKTLSSSTTAPYYVDEEEDIDDDIINDILDSEEDEVAVAEIEQEAEIKKIAELKNEVTTTTTPITSTTDEVSDLSTSDVEEPEIKEDLGNQEVVSSNQENGVVEEETVAELNTEKSLASAAEVEEKCTTPVILVNGHHNDVELESEINAAEESVA